MASQKTRAVFEPYNIVSEGDLFDTVRRLLRGTVAGTVAHTKVQLVKASSDEEIEKVGVSDGDRTHDHWSHNPEQQPKKRD